MVLRTMSAELNRARRIVHYTLGGVVILAISKIAFGLYFNSNAIVADGIHSFGDALIIILVIIALKFMSRKPTERFPYGYYKVEDLVVLFLSVIFVFLALQIIFESFTTIILWEFETVNIYASLVGFASGIVSLFLAEMQEKAAKLTNAQSILLNAKEMRYDALSSTMVGLALLIGDYIRLPMDSIAALIISFFILKIAIEGIKDSLLDLMDAWEKPKLLEEIRKIILKHEGVVFVKNVRLRKAGPLILGDASIGVSDRLTLPQIRSIEESIINQIKTLGISDFVLHVLPVEEKVSRVAIPISENKIISDHFGRAPKLLIAEVNKENGTFKILQEVENPYVQETDKAGILLVRLLSEFKVSSVIAKNIGENAFYMLRGHNIKIYKAEAEDVEDVLKKYLKNELTLLEKPTKRSEKLQENL